MRIGFISRCAIGLAIALTLGGVSTLDAQQADSTHRNTKTTTKTRKPASSQRIPIVKESGGEVDLPPLNQDSIAAAERARQEAIAAAAERARQDALERAEQMRRDSIAAAERARQEAIAAAERARRDSIARADSIAAAEAARVKFMQHHGGWYFGVGVGASIPTGGYTNAGLNSPGYSTGWDVMVPVGYDFPYSPVGVRFDLDYHQLNGKHFNTTFNSSVDTPNLHGLAGNLDLRLRLPLGRTWNRFYALGGVTYANISGWPQDFSNPNAPQNKYTFGDSNGRWGWNAGGGFNFNWGKMAGLFIESRYISIDANTVVGFPYTRAAWVPIVLGGTF